MTDTIAAAPSCADPFEEDMISLDEALLRIERLIEPVGERERLPIRECLGRVVAADVTSPVDVPPAANSAMDGYALAIDSLDADSISELDVIGTALAGVPFDGRCGPGQCLRITTGALLPDGADTVVMQEQTEISAEGRVRIDGNHRRGENIRLPGEDVRRGDGVIEAGSRISPADLGVLASLGIGELEVGRKPAVAFFSTGDELQAVGTALAPGKIYDSNRYSLYGMLARLAVDSIDLGVVADEPGAMRDALAEAAGRADLIISTGGVSVGEADYIKPALADIGSTEFWKIAIKPGRPLTLGRIGSAVFMGLPGNPVAVMVTFSQFVVPVIELLSGARARRPALFRARALDKLRKKAGRYEFQRGVASIGDDGEWQVARSGRQGSGILTSMSRANCFIVLPDATENVAPGDEVKIQFFDWSL